MIQLAEPITAIGLAIITGIAWIIIALFRWQQTATKAHTDILNRLKRLEEWRMAHQEETNEYQKVLREVQQELHYWRGRRDARDPDK